MWYNYFFQIQKKYNVRISKVNPLVVRFDGKDVTKNANLNFMHEFEGSFFTSFKQTISYFTEKYHGYAIFGSDEVSFIFPEPMLLVKDLDNEECNHTNEIISVFSQMFYAHFNNLYQNIDKIFWHGKCFSIKPEKLASYIKYRSVSIHNVLTTYFLKKKNIRSGKLKLTEREELCKEQEDYEALSKMSYGILYYNGYKIDLKEFIDNRKIIKIEEENANTYAGLEDF